MSTKSSFFEKVVRVRSAVASATDLRESMRLIRGEIEDADVRREFFRSLESPGWIDVLADTGLLEMPPSDATVDGRESGPSAWPQSQYLKRMATVAPQDVAHVFKTLFTQNQFVCLDMLEAAQAMPANIAATLVPNICRAIELGSLRLGFDGASDLCARLAGNGELEAAITLADVLFCLASKKDGKLFNRRDDEYWYTEGLKKVAPTLATSSARWLCDRLCNWLAIAVAGRRQFGDSSAGEYSYVWRPAIEDHEENSDGDFTSDLVTITRDVFEAAIREGSQMSIRDAVGILEKQQSQVFRRLEVHLARVFAEPAPDIARALMMDRVLLEEYAFKHEYALLMGDGWMLLADDEKATWLDRVDSITEDIRAGQKWGNDDADQHVREDRAAWWKYERLHWIREHLIGKWVEFYDEMKSKHGEPELADTNIRMGPMRWGSESPITIDELRKRSFPDAVQWVVSWTPNPRLAMGPEREGLANAFGQYIAGSAVDFSNQAAVMRHCPPIYVRTFLSKMEEAVKAGQLIDLEPVLGLCEWVVGQPSSKTVDSVRDDVWLEDRSWEWTRGEISRFIEAVCKAVSGGNPVYSVEQYREPLWKLLGQLVRDGADSAIVSDRNEEDPRTHDYVTHAINSPRGKAMEAAFEYARWVGNYVARQAGDKSAVPDGLDALPEFRSMFEWQIDASNAAVEAFAIIGMHVGLLYWIDKVWLANKVGTIFSIEPYKSGRNKECGWAAWNAFLVWVAPHVEYYKLLQSQYAYAVEQSAGLEVTERAMEQPAFRLGEHLMILYGRGHLPLDDDATLVRTFIERANPKVRRRAFSFIGWSFRREEEIPQPILNRFMAIWDFYWTKVGQVDAQASDDDLFGRWFSSGQFPDVWSLDRLEQYVRVANTFEADDELVKRLADIAAADISKSLSILEALVHGDEQGWRIHSWWESAASILKAALAASVDIRDKAQALIDYLGRRGFLQFGELLKTP